MPKEKEKQAREYKLISSAIRRKIPSKPSYNDIKANTEAAILYRAYTEISKLADSIIADAVNLPEHKKVDKLLTSIRRL